MKAFPITATLTKGLNFWPNFEFWRTGIKILPTGFLCYPPGKKPSSGWCPAAPNGGGETRSQYWFVREESEKYWEILKNVKKKTRKILQMYLKHCWIECVSLLKVLCRMLIELGHSICQSWFLERAKHRYTENVKNEARSAKHLLRE